MTLGPCRAVVFDLFGTLIPDIGRSMRDESCREMANCLGVDVERFTRVFVDSFPERITGKLGSLEDSLVALAQRAGGHPDAAMVAAAARVRRQLTASLLTDSAVGQVVVSGLRARGYRIGLITDAAPEVYELWPSSNLAGLCHVAVFSCVAGVRKPHPTLYTAAIEGLHLPPSDVLYVGDGSGHELTGATGCGMQAVLLDAVRADDSRVDADLSWTGPRIGRLEELLDSCTAVQEGEW